MHRHNLSFPLKLIKSTAVDVVGWNYSTQHVKVHEYRIDEDVKEFEMMF